MTLQRTTSRLQTVLVGLIALAVPLACSKSDDGGGPPAGSGGGSGSGGRGGSGSGGSGAVTGGATGSGGSGQTGTGGSGPGTGGAVQGGSGGVVGTDASGGGNDANTGTTPERGEVGAPGFPGWTFTKAIKMDTSAAGANVTGAVTNFPVAVVLNATNFDFEQAKAGGEDIRFGNAMGAPLPYSVELWDKAAKAAAIWVRVPMIAGNDANQSINMYWGNASAGDAGDSKAVFPAADGYLGVWHLDEDGSTTPGGYKDASAAGHHGTGVAMAPGSRSDARIGKGQKTANAMDQWISVEDMGTTFRPANMTASIWGRATSFPGRSGPGGYDTIYSSGEYWTMQKIGRSATFETCFQHICAIGRTAVQVNNWYHFTVVRAGGNHRFYVNGVQDASSGVATRADAKPLGIGNQTQYLMNAGEKRSWDGLLDEARVITGDKGANWIKLDFESQKEGSKFLIFGQTQMR
jgi:hypothetical protein